MEEHLLLSRKGRTAQAAAAHSWHHCNWLCHSQLVGRKEGKRVHVRCSQLLCIILVSTAAEKKEKLNLTDVKEGEREVWNETLN